MIRIEDFVKAINENTTALIALHKEVVPHAQFKVYKTYYYKLYRIDKPNKELLLEWNITLKTMTEEYKDTSLEADKKYLSFLVGWLASDDFKILKK